MLQLKNPHSILAAILARPDDVLDLRLPHGNLTPAWKDVESAARQANLRIRFADDREAQQVRNRRKSEHDGRQSLALATVRPKTPLSAQELLESAPSTSRGLWIALDCLQDPHNLGAIFRIAGFFAVKGIIVTKDRSAPISDTVYDVASGGVEAVPHALETNLARTIEVAKKSSLWVLGTSEHAGEDIHQLDTDRNWLVVFGNEEHGLRRLTAEHCDHLASIKPLGPVTSLNVSVAAGIVISTLSRSPPPSKS